MTTGTNLIAWPGALFALMSAVLFGASTPFAKLLLGQGSPLVGRLLRDGLENHQRE
jgi:hypothetical protein